MRKARNSAKNDKIKPKRHKNNANRTTMHAHRGFFITVITTNLSEVSFMTRFRFY